MRTESLIGYFLESRPTHEHATLDGVTLSVFGAAVVIGGANHRADRIAVLVLERPNNKTMFGFRAPGGFGTVFCEDDMDI